MALLRYRTTAGYVSGTMLPRLSVVFAEPLLRLDRRGGRSKPRQTPPCESMAAWQTNHVGKSLTFVLSIL